MNNTPAKPLRKGLGRVYEQMIEKLKGLGYRYDHENQRWVRLQNGSN